MEFKQPQVRAVQLQEITADSAAGTVEAARDLLLEYGRFVISHPRTADFCYGTLEHEAAHLPFSYTNMRGGCLIALVDDQPAGFVAWREVAASLARDVWELKRLWVRPQARGLNLGRTLTQAVIARALAARRTAIYLDTAPAVMAAAHRLYVSMGFEPCPRYNDNPVRELEWMVLPLASRG